MKLFQHFIFINRTVFLKPLTNLIINIRDVHSVHDVVVEVAHHDAPQDVEGDVGSRMAHV